MIVILEELFVTMNKSKLQLGNAPLASDQTLLSGSRNKDFSKINRPLNAQTLTCFVAVFSSFVADVGLQIAKVLPSSYNVPVLPMFGCRLR